MHTDETVCLLYLKPISHNNVTTLCTCRNLIYINWKDKWRNGFLRDDKTYWTKWQNTNGDFHHPLPCALFLDWAIYCRLENAEMLLQVWYRFFSTLMIHVEFIKTLFPEWIHLGSPECLKVILAFTGSGIFSSSEEGVFFPPLKYYPQDLSLYSKGFDVFLAMP